VERFQDTITIQATILGRRTLTVASLDLWKPGDRRWSAEVQQLSRSQDFYGDR